MSLQIILSFPRVRALAPGGGISARLPPQPTSIVTLHTGWSGHHGRLMGRMGSGECCEVLWIVLFREKAPVASSLLVKLTSRERSLTQCKGSMSMHRSIFSALVFRSAVFAGDYGHLRIGLIFLLYFFFFDCDLFLHEILGSHFRKCGSTGSIAAVGQRTTALDGVNLVWANTTTHTWQPRVIQTCNPCANLPFTVGSIGANRILSNRLQGCDVGDEAVM